MVPFPKNNYAQSSDVQVLIDSLQFLKTDSQRIPVLLKLSGLTSKLNKDTSLYYAQEARAMAESENDLEGISKAAYHTGLAHMHHGAYDIALQEFFDVVQSFKNLQLLKEQGDALDNIGSIFYYKGDYSTALKYYIQSYSIRDSINDENGVNGSLINIGNIYKEQNQYAKATDYLMKAIKQSLTIKHLPYLAIGFNNMGLCYKQMGEYEKALDYFDKSVRVKQKTNDIQGLASTYNNIGSVFELMQEHEKAMKYYKDSYAIKLKVNDKRGIALSCINIGALYFAQKNYSKAEDFFVSALVTGREINSYHIILHASKALKNLSLENRDYKMACTYWDEFKAASDSVESQKKKDEITHLLLSHMFEKKQRELRLEQENKNILHKQEIEYQKHIRNMLIVFSLILIVALFFILKAYRLKQKANTLLREQKEEIIAQRDEIERQKNNYQQLNKTKDKFFSIVAHDLKNPFQTLISFSTFIISHFTNFKEEKKLNYLRLMKESAQNTYAFLENLLDWARAQTNDIKYVPAENDFYKIVSQVFDFHRLTAEKKNISLQTEIEENCIGFFDKNMIDTVVRNLVSNALKFTDNGGKIEIQAQAMNSHLEICVSDTGVGIDPVLKKKLFKIDEYFSTEGTEEETGTGLGLIICKEFVEKNKGEIRVESEPDNGSRFYFTLPVEKAGDLHS